MEDENAFNVANAFHLKEIRVTGLAISRPSWDSETGSDLKHNLRGRKAYMGD